MIAVDTNLLVYAHRREASAGAEAHQVMVRLAEGESPWAIPWPCCYEFLSVVTNRAHLERPCHDTRNVRGASFAPGPRHRRTA